LDVEKVSVPKRELSDSKNHRRNYAIAAALRIWSM
jgi:hypothetical protein